MFCISNVQLYTVTLIDLAFFVCFCVFFCVNKPWEALLCCNVFFFFLRRWRENNRKFFSHHSRATQTKKQFKQEWTWIAVQSFWLEKKKQEIMIHLFFKITQKSEAAMFVSVLNIWWFSFLLSPLRRFVYTGDKLWQKWWRLDRKHVIYTCCCNCCWHSRQIQHRHTNYYIFIGFYSVTIREEQQRHVFLIGNTQTYQWSSSILKLTSSLTLSLFVSGFLRNSMSVKSVRRSCGRCSLRTWSTPWRVRLCVCVCV